jgi:hypothetical protein
MFFIDKDFDGLVTPKKRSAARRYVTDYYSIENFLVNTEALAIILNDLSGISNLDENYKRALAGFTKLESGAERLMRPLITIYMAHIRKGGPRKFGQVIMGRLFEVDAHGTITKKPKALEQFLDMAEIEISMVPLSAIRFEYKRIVGIDKKLWLRGKCELWLFARFLKSFYKSLPGIKAPPALAQDMLIEPLAGRLVERASLATFLDKELAR